MPEGEQATAFTFGYGDKDLDQVLSLLADHGVDRVADVRAIAVSSVEAFSEEALAESLGAEGIAYSSFGELGDFQPEPYPSYMTTEAFEQAFGELTGFLEGHRGAVMCQCPDVGSCHRRFLARGLAEAGLRVVHLTPAGPTEAVTL